MKSELLQDIQEQKDKVGLVIDADSQIYLSAYRFRDTDDIELIYAEFWMRIKSIETEIWKHYQVDDVVIAITSKKNFRHKLTDKWKANRKAKDEKDLTEKQLEAQRSAEKLKKLVSETKKLLASRMSKSSSYRVSVSNLAEADDTFIDYTNNKGYVGVTIDSDCLKQSKMDCFNPKSWKWSDGNSDEDIFFHIIYDCLQGGHNNAISVKGCGKVCAEKFIKELEVGEKGFVDFVDLFEVPEDGLLSYQLNDCSQIKDGVLKLVTIEELTAKFDLYCEEKF